MIPEFLPGDTFKFKWISSGTSVTDVFFNVFTGSETLVSSETMTNSGGGFWYINYTVPTSEGYYVAKTEATISGKPYKKARRFRVVNIEVD
jgi:hypothetical protein